jgi:branched-subunit amino acid ABC-type transport system permease component
MTFNFFMQNLVNALQWGSFYALIALGYSMVYSILMLFNFAHGDIFMVGAYIGLGVATGVAGPVRYGRGAILPGGCCLVLTILISMFLTAFVGIIVERVGYRPLREAPRASAAITGLMIGIILETANILFLGGSRLKFPQLIESVTYNIGGVYVTNKKIMIVLVSIGLMLALHQLITRTKWGMAMRAMAYDYVVVPLGGRAHEHHCRHDLCHRFGPGRRSRHPVWPGLSGAGSVHGRQLRVESLRGRHSRRARLHHGGLHRRLHARFYRDHDRAGHSDHQPAVLA